MGRVLRVAAVFEAIVGISFVLVPAPVAELILGKEVAGAPVLVARLIGVGLVALGLACWVRSTGIAPRLMLAYNVLASLGLLGLGLVSATTGVLLWPAFLVHAVLTVLLILERRAAAESQTAEQQP